MQTSEIPLYFFRPTQRDRVLHFAARTFCCKQQQNDFLLFRIDECICVSSDCNNVRLKKKTPSQK